MQGNATSMEMGLKWHVECSQITKTMQSWHATHAHTQGHKAQIQKSYLMQAKITQNDKGQS